MISEDKKAEHKDFTSHIVKVKQKNKNDV